MKQIYFIRHSLKDRQIKKQDAPLSQEGQSLAKLLPAVFSDIAVDTIYSSPYIRSIDTVKPIAESKGLPIIIKDSLGERKVGTSVTPVDNFAVTQWNDFDFKLENGESLNEVKIRLLAALDDCLKQEDHVVIIGGHSTAFAVLFHTLTDGKFGYQEYKKMPSPGIFLGTFENGQLLNLKAIPTLNNI